MRALSLDFEGLADRITAAAVRTADGRIFQGARHPHALWAAGFGLNARPVGAEQGFVTADGRFLTREQAGALAQRTGQLKPGVVLSERGGQLFSEDLW